MKCQLIPSPAKSEIKRLYSWQSNSEKWYLSTVLIGIFSYSEWGFRSSHVFLAVCLFRMLIPHLWNLSTMLQGGIVCCFFYCTAFQRLHSLCFTSLFPLALPITINHHCKPESLWNVCIRETYTHFISVRADRWHSEIPVILHRSTNVAWSFALKLLIFIDMTLSTTWGHQICQ